MTTDDPALKVFLTGFVAIATGILTNYLPAILPMYVVVPLGAMLAGLMSKLNYDNRWIISQYLVRAWNIIRGQKIELPADLQILTPVETAFLRFDNDSQTTSGYDSLPSKMHAWVDKQISNKRLLACSFGDHKTWSPIFRYGPGIVFICTSYCYWTLALPKSITSAQEKHLFWEVYNRIQIFNPPEMAALSKLSIIQYPAKTTRDLSPWRFSALVGKDIRRVEKAVSDFISGEYQRKYHGMGYPSLGILLHGKPGTGKSSVISAIAGLTNRSLVMVNLRQVKTSEEFTDLMLGITYPLRTHILVFEEIDTVECTHTRRDELKVAQTESEMYVRLKDAILESMKKATNYEELMKLKKEFFTVCDQSVSASGNTLNLGTMLTAIAGVDAVKDRIMIATTNHPDRLDPALTRPGRFDLRVSLGTLDATSLQELGHKIFGESTPVNPKQDFTPVEAREIALTCKNFAEYKARLEFH